MIYRRCHIHKDDIIKPQGLHIVLTESFHGVPGRERKGHHENTWLEQHENPLAPRFYFINRELKNHDEVHDDDVC